MIRDYLFTEDRYIILLLFFIEEVENESDFIVPKGAIKSNDYPILFFSCGFVNVDLVQITIIAILKPILYYFYYFGLMSIEIVSLLPLDLFF